MPQWSKWPNFVFLDTLRAPRGGKKSKWLNWSPLWYVGAPNWKKLSKLSKLNKDCQKKLCFLKGFFLTLFNLGWILSLQLTKVVFSLVWHPWAHVNSGYIIVLRFIWYIFVSQCHLAIFFIHSKLKPDITCIDLILLWNTLCNTDGYQLSRLYMPDAHSVCTIINESHFCPIHVVTFTLISNLATDYIQKRRGEHGLFSFEYNLSPNLISK